MKDNQTMKFGQLIEYSQRNNFFKNYAENEARSLFPDVFLFSKMSSYKVKANGLQFGFTIFQLPLN